jgi:hypothetical protein
MFSLFLWVGISVFLSVSDCVCVKVVDYHGRKVRLCLAEVSLLNKTGLNCKVQLRIMLNRISMGEEQKINAGRT